MRIPSWTVSARRIRYEETALGNFVADIMGDHTGAQMALINSGAMRASIQARTGDGRGCLQNRALCQ